MFEFEEDLGLTAKIKVVGIGGGGGNAIKTMMRSRLEGIDFLAINTDIQALKQNEAPTKIQIGNMLTRGLGAGANPDVGRQAALEDAQMIGESLKGADMVFVTAGMGGGTGTGAAPIIARIAKDLDLLTVGVVTKPFSFEGKKRMRQADAGINALKQEVDTLICIPNDNLLNLADRNTPIIDSFKMADHVLLQAVRGISDLITTPGLINLDFADVNTIMRNAGVALMGTGVAAGENRAIEAARLAISSPLLEDISISGATGLLLNITGSSNMTLFEVNEACKLIQQEAHSDANIIFGSVIDDSAKDEISVTVIATGFDNEQLKNVEEETVSKKPSRIVNNWLNEKLKKTHEEKPEPERDMISITKPSLPGSKTEDCTIQDVFEDQHHVDANVLANQNMNTIQQNSDWEPINLFSQEKAKATKPRIEEEKPVRENTDVLQAQNSSSFIQKKQPTSRWGDSAPKQEPKAKRPSASRVSNVQQVIQEVNIDEDWFRKPEGQVKEQSDFRRALKELSSVSAQEDDIYDIPAFIRRRAD